MAKMNLKEFAVLLAEAKEEIGGEFREFATELIKRNKEKYGINITSINIDTQNITKFGSEDEFFVSEVNVTFDIEK